MAYISMDYDKAIRDTNGGEPCDIEGYDAAEESKHRAVPATVDHVKDFLNEAQDPSLMVTSEYAKKKADAENLRKQRLASAEAEYQFVCEQLTKGYLLEADYGGNLSIHLATGQTIELNSIELLEQGFTYKHKFNKRP